MQKWEYIKLIKTKGNIISFGTSKKDIKKLYNRLIKILVEADEEWSALSGEVFNIGLISKKIDDTISIMPLLDGKVTIYNVEAQVYKEIGKLGYEPLGNGEFVKRLEKKKVI